MTTAESLTLEQLDELHDSLEESLTACSVARRALEGTSRFLTSDFVAACRGRCAEIFDARERADAMAHLREAATRWRRTRSKSNACVATKSERVAAKDELIDAIDTIAQTSGRPTSSADASDTDVRLRMKIWTDPTTTHRYLMPTAFFRDVANGKPASAVICAYAMRDDDTRLVDLTVDEWNALPFFYFEEDGPAPRATPRSPDVVVGSPS